MGYPASYAHSWRPSSLRGGKRGSQPVYICNDIRSYLLAPKTRRFSSLHSRSTRYPFLTICGVVCIFASTSEQALLILVYWDDLDSTQIEESTSCG